mmetsp:Transcript_28913/g.49274  ORF Transcript_28913/g.49274 Transcript_28913/m.49274 type:complete len:429 (+) Transcript_28913:2488-3774(+)
MLRLPRGANHRPQLRGRGGEQRVRGLLQDAVRADEDGAAKGRRRALELLGRRGRPPEAQGPLAVRDDRITGPQFHFRGAHDVPVRVRGGLGRRRAVAAGAARELRVHWPVPAALPPQRGRPELLRVPPGGGGWQVREGDGDPERFLLAVVQPVVHSPREPGGQYQEQHRVREPGQRLLSGGRHRDPQHDGAQHGSRLPHRPAQPVLEPGPDPAECQLRLRAAVRVLDEEQHERPLPECGLQLPQPRHRGLGRAPEDRLPPRPLLRLRRRRRPAAAGHRRRRQLCRDGGDELGPVPRRPGGQRGRRPAPGLGPCGVRRPPADRDRRRPPLLQQQHGRPVLPLGGERRVQHGGRHGLLPGVPRGRPAQLPRPQRGPRHRVGGGGRHGLLHARRERETPQDRDAVAARERAKPGHGQARAGDVPLQPVGRG